MPLAYFNYCRDIIRHKWPFRGFYLCSLGSFTRDAGLLYHRASGFWAVEWELGCNTWIQLFKHRDHSYKQSQVVAHVGHNSPPVAEPGVLLLVQQSFSLSCPSMRLSSPCLVRLFQIFRPVSRMHFLFIWHFLFVPSFYLPNIILLWEFSPSF